MNEINYVLELPPLLLLFFLEVSLTPDLCLAISKFLKSPNIPSFFSLVYCRPLENLKTCLSSLHSEISNLQTHMDQHKNAIQTNNESWRYGMIYL